MLINGRRVRPAFDKKGIILIIFTRNLFMFRNYGAK